MPRRTLGRTARWHIDPPAGDPPSALQPDGQAVHFKIEHAGAAAVRGPERRELEEIMTRSTVSGAVGALLLLAGAPAAEAAPATAKVADAAPQVHAAAIERDEDSTCSRARRRLWIDGEGWVVRRIKTCR